MATRMDRTELTELVLSLKKRLAKVEADVAKLQRTRTPRPPSRREQ